MAVYEQNELRPKRWNQSQLVITDSNGKLHKTNMHNNTESQRALRLEIEQPTDMPFLYSQQHKSLTQHSNANKFDPKAKTKEKNSRSTSSHKNLLSKTEQKNKTRHNMKRGERLPVRKQQLEPQWANDFTTSREDSSSRRRNETLSENLDPNTEHYRFFRLLIVFRVFAVSSSKTFRPNHPTQRFALNSRLVPPETNRNS